MNLAFLSSKLSSCYISFNKAETENIKRIGKRTGKREIRGLKTYILSLIDFGGVSSAVLAVCHWLLLPSLLELILLCLVF
jgi:hypothetical protein